MECVLLWSLRLPARENAKLHYVHLCGLFSLWSQKGLFGPPCAQDWRMTMAETTSNQLPICLGIRHIYGRDNQKCDEKGSKRFGLKMRYNGRVMALEVYFFQWVPSLVAPGGIFSYCGRARAYTHVLARVYSTRASTCTLYTCFTLPHTRVNLTGLQLWVF